MRKLSDKILGMLWGLHAGDSLGATLEFLPPSADWNVHTEIVGGGEFKWRPGEATDDTDLMLCLLRSIDNTSEISFDNLKKEMLLWYRSNPPDIGKTTIRGLQNIEKDLPLHECGPVDELFQGNGSLMRVAPLSLLSANSIGIFEGNSIIGLSKISNLQTKMTHGHQHCVDCDMILISALQKALSGATQIEIFNEALEKARGISTYIYERISKTAELQWHELPTSGFCVDTLCAGLWALLKHSHFEDALVAVVNRGDDADSSGAVAGALCGAYYGADAIPRRWLCLLEYRDEIEKILKQKGFLN
jgi:ADP-ribosyl-[dinitrogen reductase] hydrolase